MTDTPTYPLVTLMGQAFQQDVEVTNLPDFASKHLQIITRLVSGWGPEADDEATLWALASARDLRAVWVRLGLSLLEGKDIGDVTPAVDIYQKAKLDGGFGTLRVLLKIKTDEKIEEQVAERCLEHDVEWEGVPPGDPQAAREALLTIPDKRQQLVVRQWVKTNARELTKARARVDELEDKYSELVERQDRSTSPLVRSDRMRVIVPCTYDTTGRLRLATDKYPSENYTSLPGSIRDDIKDMVSRFSLAPGTTQEIKIPGINIALIVEVQK